MIGSLKGVIKHKQAPWLLLEVSGVGYEIEAPMTTFYDLPEVGQNVDLHTHLVVREDAQLLYGFSRVGQRDVFRLLLKVNGIGPRVALAILSTLSNEELAHCVHYEDVAQLTRVPGIGKKTAERVLIEMRDKVDQLTSAGNASMTDNNFGDAGDKNRPLSASPVTIENDALSALEALGYKATEAIKVIKAVIKQHGNTDSSEELIRLALKSLSSK